MKEKHNLKNEFIQLFIINLEIGNEDIFKILHLVSNDFGNADSRTHLFTAFEKYFLEQNQDCHATGAFYGINGMDTFILTSLAPISLFFPCKEGADESS